MSIFAILLVVMVLRCISVSKLIKLYTLNMCSLLYVNYTSIKWICKKTVQVERWKF